MSDKPKKLLWTPQLVRRFWDYQSGFPENYFTNRFGAQIAKSISPFLRGRARVLDYGCGMGFLLPHLAHHAAGVAGADVSPKSIGLVNEKCAGIKNFLGAYSIDELVKTDQKFDAVVAVEVIEHLYDEQLDGLLGYVRCLLNPDGIVIFTTPNEEDLSLNEIYCPESDAVFHRWQHVQRFDAETLGTLMAKGGFAAGNIFTTDFAAQGQWQRLRAAIRPFFGKRNPHLVYVGRKAG